MKRSGILSSIKKLTILDYILIVIGLAVLFGLLVFIPRKKEIIYVYTTNFLSNQWAENPFPDFFWVANNVKNGDIAYDTRGVKIASVESVNNTDWGGQRRYVLLKLKMTAILDKRTGQYRVGDIPIEVGSPLSLRINNTNYTSLVTYVGKDPQPENSEYKKAELQLKVPKVEPWQASTYNSDFLVRNTEGEVLFKIVKSEIKPAEQTVGTADGRLVRTSDPYYKDVYITSEAQVLCQRNICYFNEFVPIKIGGWFWVQNETGFISGDSRIVQFKLIN